MQTAANHGALIYVLQILIPCLNRLCRNAKIHHSPKRHPDFFALQVGLQACVIVATEVGDIEAVNGNAKLLGQQLHGHLTSQMLQHAVVGKQKDQVK